jgi:hypothetical protein
MTAGTIFRNILIEVSFGCGVRDSAKALGHPPFRPLVDRWLSHQMAASAIADQILISSYLKIHIDKMKN